jgi:Transposase DDE domain group 1
LETKCATFATARWPPDTLREPHVLAATRQTAEYVGIADRLARCFPDRRDPTKLSDMIRARTFAISCGYEDADDFMRTDPGFKLACGKLPDAGSDCVRRRRCRGWRMRLR